MRIGIVIDDISYDNLKINDFEYANPGVGGTTYQMIQIFLLFNKNTKYKTYLVHNNKGNFLDCNSTLNYSTDTDFIGIVKKMDFEVIIVQQRVGYNILNELSILNIDVIYRCGNYLNSYEVKLYNKYENVHVVMLNNVQRLKYLDTNILERTYVISNKINYDIVLNEMPIKNASNEIIILYIGAMTESKGLDRLLKIWPRIYNEFIDNDVKLKIIGTSNLYGKNNWNKLNTYEMKIERILCSMSSKEKDSIEFLGKLGLEKYEFIKKASLGVVNPIGKSEVFTNSAIDFTLFQVPIVTINRFGLREIVENGKNGYKFNFGFLFYRKLKKVLKKKIHNKLQLHSGPIFLMEKFKKTPFEDWIRLVDYINGYNQNLKLIKFHQNFKGQIKYCSPYLILVYLNSILKKIVPFLPSIVSYEFYVKNIYRKIKIRIKKF